MTADGGCYRHDAATRRHHLGLSLPAAIDGPTNAESVRQVGSILKALGERIGKGDFSGHSLRVGMAMGLVADNAELGAVMQAQLAYSSDRAHNASGSSRQANMPRTPHPLLAVHPQDSEACHASHTSNGPNA
jgi:hypothetical protein